jgi:hypothetical protein
LTLGRELGDQTIVVEALVTLGSIAESQAEHDAACRHFGESLVLCQRQGYSGHLLECLAALARVAAAEQQPARAARLFGVAAAYREAGSLDQPSAPSTADECQMAAARAALGEPAFAAAWAEGQAMTLDQAVVLALAEPAS